MLDLTDVLGWGSLDIEKLEEYLKIAKKFGVTIDDIREEIQETFRYSAGEEGDIADINNWFYVAIHEIFYAIMDEVRNVTEDEEILKKIEELENNFNPYINYMDSWFNNLLDEIDFTKDKEEIIEEVIRELRAN
jgi:uncharacterized coiled-coil DUF342 family protein